MPKTWSYEAKLPVHNDAHGFSDDPKIPGKLRLIGKVKEAGLTTEKLTEQSALSLFDLDNLADDLLELVAHILRCKRL